MTSPYADYERTGYKKLLQLAQVLCKLVTQWAVVIRAKYGDNVSMMALLVAVEGLCSLIPEAAAEYSELTLNQGIPNDDAALIAGSDPAAPAPVAPDA